MITRTAAPTWISALHSKRPARGHRTIGRAGETVVAWLLSPHRDCISHRSPSYGLAGSVHWGDPENGGDLVDERTCRNRGAARPALPAMPIGSGCSAECRGGVPAVWSGCACAWAGRGPGQNTPMGWRSTLRVPVSGWPEFRDRLERELPPAAEIHEITVEEEPHENWQGSRFCPASSSMSRPDPGRLRRFAY